MVNGEGNKLSSRPKTTVTRESRRRRGKRPKQKSLQRQTTAKAHPHSWSMSTTLPGSTLNHLQIWYSEVIMARDNPRRRQKAHVMISTCGTNCQYKHKNDDRNATNHENTLRRTIRTPLPPMFNLNPYALSPRPLSSPHHSEGTLQKNCKIMELTTHRPV